MGSALFDFAITTIFAREFLEGAIIIGEYRTIILRSESENKNEALRAIWMSALVATIFALMVIVAIAVPLIVLSSTFDESTSKIIEGISKIVAGVCLLQLSLKIPKFLGIYGSCKKHDETKPPEQARTRDVRAQEDIDSAIAESEGRVKEAIPGLTMRNMQFNVAWNIWREVAECGVFLIPSFLSGDNLKAIPVSAVIGSMVGLAVGFAIYWANHRLKNKVGLAVFAVLLLVFLSAGLTTGGFHNLEKEWVTPRLVWELKDEFWDVNRLPMTILKPFGYNDSRTVLEICIYWGWLLMSAVLHYRKYRRAPKIRNEMLTEHSRDGSTPVESQSEESDILQDEESQMKHNSPERQDTELTSSD